MSTLPELFFTGDFDEVVVFEVEKKGYLQDAFVRMPDGFDIKVCFWDPTRLRQDLETDLGLGKRCFAEPGLIVVPAVTVDNMKAAVTQLYEDGFFERLLSLSTRATDEKM